MVRDLPSFDWRFKNNLTDVLGTVLATLEIQCQPNALALFKMDNLRRCFLLYLLKWHINQIILFLIVVDVAPSPSPSRCPVYWLSSLGQIERMNLTTHTGMCTLLHLPNTPYSVRTKHRYRMLRLWLLLIAVARMERWPVRASWWSETKHGSWRQSRQMTMVTAFTRCCRRRDKLWEFCGGLQIWQ